MTLETLSTTVELKQFDGDDLPPSEELQQLAQDGWKLAKIIFVTVVRYYVYYYREVMISRS